MNSSYEPHSSAARLASRPESGAPCASPHYLPMEYREASAPEMEECPSGQDADDGNPSASAGTVEPQPDLEELVAARVELQRRAVTAQAQQEAAQEIQRARATVACAIEQFTRQRDEYFRQAEGEIVNLSLAIARKIIHRESQIDPRLLAGLVRHELEQLEAATSVRLLVSPETLSYWGEALRSLPRPVEVAPDAALAAGEARIETALGSTTLGFDRELKEIERGFFDLLARRPGAAEAKEAKAVRLQ
jgi:flagellar assembly protein FliH